MASHSDGGPERKQLMQTLMGGALKKKKGVTLQGRTLQKQGV